MSDDAQLVIDSAAATTTGEKSGAIKRRARAAAADAGEQAEAEAQAAAEREHPPGSIAVSAGWELRLGQWETVLADVGEVDAQVSDPPYGLRVHESEVERGDGVLAVGLTPGYEAWTRDHVFAYVRHWSPRVRDWMVNMTSHDLIPHWEDAFADVGRYAYAPVIALVDGMTVRQLGDGPSSWAIHVMVARPIGQAKWGTLRGGYHGKRQPGAGGGRGKPDWLVAALVRDYSRPGNRIVDPMAGWGATLKWAAGLGRTAIGAERDALAYAKAVKHLRCGAQTDMFAGAAP